MLPQVLVKYRRPPNRVFQLSFDQADADACDRSVQEFVRTVGIIEQLPEPSESVPLNLRACNCESRETTLR